MLFEKQDFQHECVENILSLISKVDVRTGDYSNLQDAVKEHYKTHSYTQFKTTRKPQLDVLMETGTGKTYTYIKTIFELHKRHYLKKFIIVLPRTAIKLGVIQNIRLSDEHFYNEYTQHLRYITYPEDGIEKVRNDFVRDDSLSILLLTNASFNKAKDNVINKRMENLFEHTSIWHAIAARNPLVIIDEPHLLKGNKTLSALKQLKQSLFIRFGATYPQETEHALSNVAYALDSISSFAKFLVKRIRVNTLNLKVEQSKLRIIETSPREKTYKIDYNINTVTRSQTMKISEDIGAKTQLDAYRNICATKIQKDKVFFSNKTIQDVYSGQYSLHDNEMRTMIRTTIAQHFEKEEAFFYKGIKILSLFFIPNICDFRGDNPKVKHIFQEEYKNIHGDFFTQIRNEAYKMYLDKDYKDGTLRVHQGYFSGDKGTKDEQEAQGVKLILEEKEKLLCFDTPLRFIFSVWALQEGWDNPNVVNICKLNSTSHEISRRQQVGRGLRLSVNQAGKRSTIASCNDDEHEFFTLNTLDMIVSSKEKEFIEEIQQEIQDASYRITEGAEITLELLKKHVHDEDIAVQFYGALIQEHYVKDRKQVKPIRDFLHRENERLAFLSDEQLECLQKVFAPHVRPVLDGNKQIQRVCIREDKWKQFQKLWETINKKAQIVYKNVRDETIIGKVVAQFQKETIDEIKTTIETKTYNASKNIIETNNVESCKSVPFFQEKAFTDFLNDFIKKEKLPLSFVLHLCNALHKAGQMYKIKANPPQAKERLRTLVQENIHALVITSVAYNFSETRIYPNRLQDTNGLMKPHIDSGVLGRSCAKENVQDHLLYDTVCYDSLIEKNIQQQESQVINGNSVKVFAKLPRIAIPTPYKTYSPDFAYLIETKDNKKLFLIVETKGQTSETDLRNEEKQKIEYAKKFFENLQQHIGDDVRICYKTRMNKEELSTLVTTCF